MISARNFCSGQLNSLQNAGNNREIKPLRRADNYSGGTHSGAFTFVHDDVVYCKYYEVVYILFHTGMRISEFCGLTLKDIDLQNKTVNIDHQLQRTSDMRYIIETTKTDAGTRVLPITEDVAQMFQAIIED